MIGEIRAHARGTVTHPAPVEPDDQIDYDGAHDSLQQQGVDDEERDGDG